jgi:hypothetical protein
MYNKGKATFKSIGANIKAVAVAITSKMRRQGSGWDGTPVYALGTHVQGYSSHTIRLGLAGLSGRATGTDNFDVTRYNHQNTVRRAASFYLEIVGAAPAIHR